MVYDSGAAQERLKPFQTPIYGYDMHLEQHKYMKMCLSSGWAGIMRQLAINLLQIILMLIFPILRQFLRLTTETRCNTDAGFS